MAAEPVGDPGQPGLPGQPGQPPGGTGGRGGKGGRGSRGPTGRVSRAAIAGYAILSIGILGGLYLQREASKVNCERTVLLRNDQVFLMRVVRENTRRGSTLDREFRKDVIASLDDRIKQVPPKCM